MNDDELESDIELSDDYTYVGPIIIPIDQELWERCSPLW